MLTSLYTVKSDSVITYDRAVARWAPGARGRLQEAAFELYGEKGFEQTTVGEIAARAGVTERTFYRYFADKREVFFDGSRALTDFLVAAVAEGPAGADPLEMVLAALCRAGRELFAERRALARRRQALVEANPELYERELAKMAGLTASLSGALRARGVAEPAARLASETGIGIFRTAFARWVEPAEPAGASGAPDAPDAPGLDAVIVAVFGELSNLVGRAGAAGLLQAAMGGGGRR